MENHQIYPKKRAALINFLPLLILVLSPLFLISLSLPDLTLNIILSLTVLIFLLYILNKNINKIRNKVSIYYNMMLDISKTTNNKHYERFILELLRLIDNPTTIDSSITKKRRGSSF